MHDERAQSDPAALLERNLRFLPGFSFFSYAFACVPLLYFFMVVERGLSIGQYALLQTIYYVAMLSFELPTGWLADRIGRRLPLTIGPVVLGSGFFVMFLAKTFWGFALGELLFAAGHALLSGPPAALLFESLLANGREEEYLRQESRMSTWRSVGTAASFLLGGLTGQFLGLAEVVLLTSILVALAGIFGALLLDPSGLRPSDSGREEGKRPLGTRLLAVLSQAEIRWILTWFVLLFFLLRYCFHTYQPWLEQAKETGPLLVAGMFAAFAFVAAPFTRMVPRVRALLGERLLLILLPITVSISLLGLSIKLSLALIPFFFLQQIPFGLHWPLVNSYLNHRIPSEDRALTLSILSFCGRLGFALLLPLVLRDNSRMDFDYLVVGASSLVLGLVLALLMPRSPARSERPS